MVLSLPFNPNWMSCWASWTGSREKNTLFLFYSIRMPLLSLLIFEFKRRMQRTNGRLLHGRRRRAFPALLVIVVIFSTALFALKYHHKRHFKPTTAPFITKKVLQGENKAADHSAKPSATLTDKADADPRLLRDPAVAQALQENKPRPSVLAVIIRYNEDVSWIHNPNTGLPILDDTIIYQISDIGTFNNDTKGQPFIPGAPPPSSSNESYTWPSWSQYYIDHPDLNAPTQSTAYNFDGITAEIAARAARERTTRWKDGNTTMEKAPPVSDNGPIIIPDISPTVPLVIIPNRGFEALAILTSIIDHYNDDSNNSSNSTITSSSSSSPYDFMLFMQGHRHHWHTIMAQDWVLRRLNTIMPDPAKLNDNIKTQGYYSLQCIEYADGQRIGGPNARNILRPRDIGSNPHSPNGPYWVQTLAGRFDLWWEDFGKRWFHDDDGIEKEVPEELLVPCCSTFIVSKEAIKRWPLEFYVELREYVLLSAMDGKWMATVLEHAWPLVFANITEYYQPQDVCMCELYHMCTS